MDSPVTARRDLSQYLTQAEAVILPRQLAEKAEPAPLPPDCDYIQRLSQATKTAPTYRGPNLSRNDSLPSGTTTISIATKQVAVAWRDRGAQ